MRKKLRLAALISGGASTAAAIFKACGTERLPDVEMPLVIASNNSAGECLRELPNCPQIVVIRRRDSKSRHFFGQMILAHLRMYNIDFVGQYGWMPFTPDCVVHAFEGRIANQHPGNPRWFGGSKMDGIRVSCARLNFVRAVNRDFFTEAVTHWVTSVLDGGAIIKSRRIPTKRDDTCRTLYDRVKPIEWEVQIELLRDVCSGTVEEVSYDPPLVRPGEQEILARAKQEAIQHHPD